MIYVVDNGGSYSDHTIYFVEAFTGGEMAIVHDVAALLKLSTSLAGVLFSAKDVAWYEGEPLTVQDFADSVYFHIYATTNEGPAKELALRIQQCWLSEGFKEPLPYTIEELIDP